MKLVRAGNWQALYASEKKFNSIPRWTKRQRNYIILDEWLGCKSRTEKEKNN